jgi:hypothetical protein
MNNALRYAGAAFALGLLLVGLMALLNNLIGERSESFTVPCLLMALGLGSGALVWHLPGFGGSGDCDAEDFANSGEMRDGDSGAV